MARNPTEKGAKSAGTMARTRSAQSACQVHERFQVDPGGRSGPLGPDSETAPGFWVTVTGACLAVLARRSDTVQPCMCEPFAVSRITGTTPPFTVLLGAVPGGAGQRLTGPLSRDRARSHPVIGARTLVFPAEEFSPPQPAFSVARGPGSRWVGVDFRDGCHGSLLPGAHVDAGPGACGESRCRPPASKE